MKEEIITREKIVAQIIVNPKLSEYIVGADSVTDFNIFCMDELMYRMSQDIWTKTIPERSVVHCFERPTFWEWLTRKPRAVRIKINAKDIVIDPPITAYDTLRIYNIDAETQK